MVERFQAVGTDEDPYMVPTTKGPWVRFSDYEALAARVAVLEAALGLATRILSYPVDTSIQERGYSLRTDDDSVGHAVEVLIAAISSQPTHATQVEQIAALSAKLAEAERERDEARRSAQNAHDADAKAFLAANFRAEAAEARVAELEKALTAIAHTFTENSFGDMVTMPAPYYQEIARAALSATKEPKPDTPTGQEDGT